MIKSKVIDLEKYRTERQNKPKVDKVANTLVKLSKEKDEVKKDRLFISLLRLVKEVKETKKDE